MKILFAVLDTETTGTDPEQHALVEIARTYVWSDSGVDELSTDSSLIKPPHPIPPEASAIHHITDDDVADEPTARDVVPLFLETEAPDPIWVAHQAEFEKGFLKNYMPAEAKWICTYRAALRVWPDAPNHKNETLRYYLGLKIKGTQTHRASHDTIVTAHILVELLKHASVEDMLAWTLEPPVLPRCPIGQEWRGKPWSEVDRGFLDWILKQPKMEEDLKWNARREIDRRHIEAIRADRSANEDRQIAYLALAEQAIKVAKSVYDLRKWYREEAGRRSEYGLNPERINTLIDYCKARTAELQSESTMTAEKVALAPTKDVQDGQPISDTELCAA